MTYCGENSVVKTETGVKTAISLRCRAWTCTECSEIRKKQLIAEAIGGAPNTFLTLTLRRSQAKTPEEAAKTLSRAWRIVRLRLMRLRKWKHLPFIAIFEPHASGWPHLHILLRSGWIDRKWLSVQMDAICSSPIVDIRRIDHKGRVAGYCAKYCSKGTVKFGTSKRYWQTPDFDLRPAPEAKLKAPLGEGWEREPWPLWKWCKALKSVGYTIERTSNWKAIARPPP